MFRGCRGGHLRAGICEFRGPCPTAECFPRMARLSSDTPRRILQTGHDQRSPTASPSSCPAAFTSRSATPPPAARSLLHLADIELGEDRRDDLVPLLDSRQSPLPLPAGFLFGGRRGHCFGFLRLGVELGQAFRIGGLDGSDLRRLARTLARCSPQCPRSTRPNRRRCGQHRPVLTREFRSR